MACARYIRARFTRTVNIVFRFANLLLGWHIVVPVQGVRVCGWRRRGLRRGRGRQTGPERLPRTVGDVQAEGDRTFRRGRVSVVLFGGFRMQCESGGFEDGEYRTPPEQLGLKPK